MLRTHLPVDTQNRAHRHSCRHSLKLLLLLVGALLGGGVHAAQIAAGDSHALLVRDDGTLWAWGNNFQWQLGDGSQTPRSSPTRILNEVQLAAGGGEHTLALRRDATLWAWGNNASGQIGDGGTTARSTPAPILGGVVAVAAGWAHSLALRADGTLWAWGENAWGQLGDGSSTNRLLPIQILRDIRALTAGEDFGLAIDKDGGLWSWGQNGIGQLGDGTLTRRHSPVRVALTDVKAVAAGQNYSLALQNDGSVWAWGANGVGQLCSGSSENSSVPIKVFNNIRAIGTRGRTSYFIDRSDTLWACGLNDWGSVGDGTTQNRNTPVKVLEGVHSIAAGKAFVLVQRTSGEVWAWGRNQYGQLSDAETLSRGAPYYTLSNVQKVTAGGYQTFALHADGNLWGWGGNWRGQMGRGMISESEGPALVMTGVKAASAGREHTLVLAQNGTLWAFGGNDFGQLGTGGSQAEETRPIRIMDEVRDIAACGVHSLALKADGSLWAWGNNNAGELGLGHTQEQAVPAQVPLTGVLFVGCGDGYSLALKSDGTLWSWGANWDGQLGDGTLTDRATPQQILDNVQTVFPGLYHAFALRADGTLWAWGYGGALGTGNGETQPRPVPIALAGVRSLAAGTVISLAMRTDGSVWTWGWNFQQTLGPGSPETQTVPAQNVYLHNLREVAAGASHFAALTENGRVATWGANRYGQLGLPRTLFSPSPRKIKDPWADFANTALVSEYFNPDIRNAAGASGIGHHFVTSSAAERSAIEANMAGPGWSLTARHFRAWNSPALAPVGAGGVCRFYAAEPNSHFYTAHAGECESLRNLNPSNDPRRGWAYEGVAFFAMPPLSSGCSMGYHPIYRSYNNRYGPPASNDGNHRLTPSFNDHRRAVVHLGYVDEGIAFCTPASPEPGGDLHATLSYPGASAQSGQSIGAEFVFSNAGPGAGDGGVIYAALPPEVTDWSLACQGLGGMTCPNPASLTPSELRKGLTITAWPPGGSLLLNASGSAPQPAVGVEPTLKFAATTVRMSGLPDPNSHNNATPTSQTVVKTPGSCLMTFAPTSLALAPTRQEVRVTISLSEGCAWTAQSLAEWLSLGVESGTTGPSASASGSKVLRVLVNENTSTTERNGKVSIEGKELPVTQAGASSSPANACSAMQLSRSGDQVAAGLMTGPASFYLIVDESCSWQATSQDSWITIVSGGAGKGNGMVSYLVDANPTVSTRQGQIRVGPTHFGVIQVGQNEGPGGDGGGDGGGE